MCACVSACRMGEIGKLRGRRPRWETSPVRRREEKEGSSKESERTKDKELFLCFLNTSSQRLHHFCINRHFKLLYFLK